MCKNSRMTNVWFFKQNLQYLENFVSHNYIRLKVESNEKLGGSERRVVLRFKLRMWLSGFIHNLNVSCVKNLFPFPLATAKLNVDVWTNRQSRDKMFLSTITPPLSWRNHTVVYFLNTRYARWIEFA